jgi:hypothetical protein
MIRNALRCIALASLSLGAFGTLGCEQVTGPDPCTSTSLDGSATSLTIGCPASNAVSWKTDTVSLSADDFWIVADGQKYTSRGATVDVHSDPGWGSYTTLELTWQENAREMRFFLYFSADATGWQVDEMRTYNGQTGYDADWLYYEGPLFRSPLGATFAGDVDLNNSPSDTLRGELHLRGLRLSTTLNGT